ncbi:MAG: 16S rRNA (guanine(966)-N(2))-methyltransferase RsmD [Alphaproteobacteria bacterium]|nr:16S rRNA (guanine(966)-N(2))-methyltransferase RsmD [Alphaproteobacteria bacterium]
MRIVAGKHRGLSLATPKDDRVRPTSDRVREALFNVLAHNDFEVGFSLEGARVLDLFAGTGALGLEALSRGAKYVLFVDDHAESRALVRRNVEAAQATGATKIWRRDATGLGDMPPNAGGPFDLVFLDPPYRKGLVELALVSARDGKWFAANALVVAEMAAGEAFVVPVGFLVVDERAYGDTRVVVLVLAAS